jgi:hypothetical protein
MIMKLKEQTPEPKGAVEPVKKKIVEETSGHAALNY